MSVTRGTDIGGVDVVMIDADIYLLAQERANGSLSAASATMLSHASQQLSHALAAFPADAQPYYQALIDIAEAALSE